MADHVQPDWLCKIPFDILNLITQKTRDALTGLTTFRSVCRTWRAAVGPAPCLLPPSPQDAAVLHAGSDHMLVFPLSHGWSIIVDPLYMSCHLSHLITGATAPLPKLNSLSDGGDTSKIIHLSRSSIELLFTGKAAPFDFDVDSSGDPDDQSKDQEACSFDEGSVSEDQNDYSYSAHEDQNEDNVSEDYDDNALSMDKGSKCEDLNKYYFAELPFFKEGGWFEDLDEHLTDQEGHKDRRHTVKTYSEDGREWYNDYSTFSNYIRFAIHVPATTQPGSAEGIVIMMYHDWLHARTNGMVFCRPGDATWRIISNPNPIGGNFVDFAYFDGKVFALNNTCVTLVFDATTLKILHQVDMPSETVNYFFKFSSGDDSEDIQSLHLLALPHKLLLVKVFMEKSHSCHPVDFHVFELRQESPNGQLAWCKVGGEGVGGNYELFMDSYHATFSNSGDGSGTRIYHADNELFGDAHCVWGYRYNMQDNKLECVHEPAQYDRLEYSTKPSWFVP